MTFGLIGWLKSQHKNIDYEIPLWYPSKAQPDNREWLQVNGLGGYSMGTVSGINTRRYHCVLAAALTPPVSRRIVLSRVEELVTINGVDYDLATSSWTSGVVSPTGYKRLECFTMLPCPTWVFELDGHYLIKRQVMLHGKNKVYFGYTLLTDPEHEQKTTSATITTRFLVGYRDFHGSVKGSSDDRYPQFVSPNQSMIILNESGARLCLAWKEGQYEAERQWWWDFNWPEESARGEKDSEDLFLVGKVTTTLTDGLEHSLGASFETAISMPDCAKAVNELIERQNSLIHRASLPRSLKTDLLILAGDQFLVPDFKSYQPGSSDKPDEPMERLSAMEGYPWFDDSGRAALTAMPGLTLSTRRFAEARAILRTFAERRQNGLVANRTYSPKLDTSQAGAARPLPPKAEFSSLDVSLWYGWALYRYFRSTKDRELVKELLPVLLEIYDSLTNATINGVTIDHLDGLIVTNSKEDEFSWMDARVAEMPITPRSGKAVELNALWYSFLETILALSGELEEPPDASELEKVRITASLVKQSMAKFWNSEKHCLYDIIDKPMAPGDRVRKVDDSVRPNQLFCVSMPFRALTKEQEKAILACVETHLLTPTGLRTLAPEDPQYQGSYGCGFAHADQYHRDLSYHQGTAWTWLLGTYIEAQLNVFGASPELTSRVKILLTPLLAHLTEEACLGNISEIFDGARPHLSRGSPAHAQATAECIRWQAWQLRQ